MVGSLFLPSHVASFYSNYCKDNIFFVSLQMNAANIRFMKNMSSQQLDLFDDYALESQKQQAANRLMVFFEATGIRRSKPLVFGEDNPLCQKEMYVPDIAGKNMGVFYQIIGNLGAYANKEFLDDTDIILLSDDTLRKLEQGIKDDVVLEMEKRHKKSSAKFLNLLFTCEADFISWVKRRLETSPDENTLRLLEIYEKG